MKKIYQPVVTATALCLMLSLHASSQKTVPSPPPAKGETEMTPPVPDTDQELIAPEPPVPPLPEIIDDNGNGVIIRQKGKKDAKITVEIHGGDVTVNGKPISDFKDKNISVSRIPAGSLSITSIDRDFSPFRENAMNQALNQAQLDRLQEDMGRQKREMELNIDRTMRRQNRMQSDRDLQLRSLSNEAYLGVASKKSEANGALVVEITPESPAEKAGVKKGDIITKVNGKGVHNPDELYKAIHEYKAGEKVKVSLTRDGKEQTVEAVLEKSKGSHTYNYQYHFQMPETYGFDHSFGEDMEDQPKLGLKAQDAEDGKGVDVLDVVAGSAIEKAGIRKGDRIVRFDGTEVNSADELADKVAGARSKVKVSLSYIRDGKTQEIELRIPRKLKSAEL